MEELYKLVNARYGRMLVNPRDEYIGKGFLKYGEFSEHEVSVFRQLLDPDAIVFDVGANIGAHTVPFAKMAAVVFAFEPQSLIFQLLCANLALNDLTNVRAFNYVIGETPGVAHIPVPDPMVVNNFGALGCDSYGEGEPVEIKRLSAFHVPRLDFIKIDVEGMEAEVILGADQLIQQHRPILYVENDKLDKSARLIKIIRELDYQLWWHCPSLFNADNFLHEKEDIFPKTNSFNMLCIPREIITELSGGFYPVEVDDNYEKLNDRLRSK